MLHHWFSYIIFMLLIAVPSVSFSQSTNSPDSPDTEATTPQTQTVDQQPVLTAPIGNISTPKPTFKWQAAAGATSYLLWVNEYVTPNIPGKINRVYTAAQAGCSNGGICSVSPGVSFGSKDSEWWVTAITSAGVRTESKGAFFAVKEEDDLLLSILPTIITATQNSKNKFIVHVNKGDPKLFEANTPEGEKIEYFGKRDSNGLPQSLSNILVTDKDNKISSIKLDNLSRPELIINSDGSNIKFNWLSDSKAALTVISADGKYQSNTTIDIVTPSSSLAVEKITDSSVKIKSPRSSLKASEAYVTSIDRTDNVKQTASSEQFSVPITAQVSYCGKPAEDAEVRFDILDRDSGKPLYSRLIARHISNGQYIADISISGVDLAPAHKVCDVFSKAVDNVCTVAGPTSTVIDIIYKKLKYINNNYQWQDIQPECKFLTVIIA